MEVDPAGSTKRGKKTNQLIYEYDSVRISAFHLQIATKSELKQGEYLREWAGTLEVPLSAALEAFEALGLNLGLNTGDSQPSTSSQPGGVTPHGYQGGDAPPTSGSTSLAPVISAPDPDKISEWMGEPGSLGEIYPGRSGPRVPVFRQHFESPGRMSTTWTLSSSNSYKCRLGSLGGSPELASYLQAAYNSGRFVGDCAL